MRPPPAHRATTAHLQALYPFVGEGGAGGGLRGPVAGTDVMGGHFLFDPWELYREGVLTNPNMVVVGQIGRGKSTFVKTFVWRQLAFGRRAWILDPKGEYGPLCRAAGTVPLELAPGGAVRLNPLDPGPGGGADPGQLLRRRVELASTLAAACLGRDLRPGERTALELAVRAASRGSAVPTLAQVVGAMLDPPADLARLVRTDPASLAADGRPAALELRRLVEGDLGGMFDGRTSAGADLDGPVVSLDLSAVFASPALPLLMACASAWMLPTGRDAGAPKRIVVLDEAWAVLQDIATARWLQSSFKLSRALGVANVAVVHRISDLRAAGSDGSAQQNLAAGLLADAETRVVFAQPPAEAAACRDLLGLSATEADLVAHLPRGVALWKLGTRSHLVEHFVAPGERDIVDTDSAMREHPRRFGGIPTENAGTGG